MEGNYFLLKMQGTKEKVNGTLHFFNWIEKGTVLPPYLTRFGFSFDGIEEFDIYCQ